ncbi:MAG: bifunctional 5,10-methylenetetrahydrofolate dehydrogenase/5,10-methenyltetrahydrofolate cyclohydrolase [Candidatus Gracilibacteria bacterium]|nr:bifunctional 5,10-methylenetetrahydrofolate dehydrogenase/5,10-methenyltetrahydrofolate cyclohydrolase [Candidatus Gracilibacteria bacterium]MDQ7023492.1 bifunctional 5,10-methylenetetrahydrofolate dehydrogenase/5,10-methenyltetrahydrofolate cyclohydrolase [Candidatus Gracilibacteria bacterium]
MIINGKKIAKNIYDELKINISEINGNKPKLGAILVGENSPSLRYIKQKNKWAKYVGIDFELKNFNNSVTEQELLNFIEKWNNDDEVSGYIIQLPLPEHINSEKVLNAIKPKKDVDGFHPENQGKVLIGDKTGFSPCTPYGVMGIFESLNIDLVGKEITVIGQSNIVGKPMAVMLMNAGATVISCNIDTPNIYKYTKKSDIVVMAAGVPGLLKLENINKNTIIIDVGFTVIEGKIYGDADFEKINNNGNLITPVPGGVGVLTVANLLKNTYKAFLQNK